MYDINESNGDSIESPSIDSKTGSKKGEKRKD